MALFIPIGCACPFPIAPVVQSESEGGLALADHVADFEHGAWVVADAAEWGQIGDDGIAAFHKFVVGLVDAFWLCFGDQYCGPGEFGVFRRFPFLKLRVIVSKKETREVRAHNFKKTVQ